MCSLGGAELTGVTRYDGPAGAIFVALAICLASACMIAGPLWWVPWALGVGGAFLLISAGIRLWIGG